MRPARASVASTGWEFQAGEMIDVDAGKHEVRIVVATKMVVQQELETRSGVQVWKLDGNRLVAQ